MYGAILGDIIGSAFEFDRGGKTKEFPLFSGKSTWTDDTVMTVAVAEALLKVGNDATVDEIKTACVQAMQKWGRKYPYAGYGGRFISWLREQNPEPYKSYGNGSAMRVSPAGWLYETVERTREVARATAEVSHNHREGIKGAECTAAVIFLARNGKSKDYIADYVMREFGYDFSETLEEMRARHAHVETCMDSLPKALRAFLDGNSFEDVVRNAVSLGGDTDTLGAIAGAMGEAMYGVPEELRKACRTRMQDDMKKVLKCFRRRVKELGNLPEQRLTLKPEQCLTLKPEQYAHLVERAKAEGNEPVEVCNRPLMEAYAQLISVRDDDALRGKAHIHFLFVLADEMRKGAELNVPVEDMNHDFITAMREMESIEMGTTFELKEGVRLRIDKMVDQEGKYWVPLFLSSKEMEKGQTANITINMSIRDIVAAALGGNVYEGLVINPFGPALPMPKVILQLVWNLMENPGSEEELLRFL